MYIGKSPQTGAYSILDSLTASLTASYTMQLNSVNYIPESAQHLIVSLNGSIQKPNSSFTVSGSTLTFSQALTSSDSIDFIYALGNVLDIGVPSDSTISTAKIIDSAVTNAKLANSSITLNGSAVSLGGSATISSNSGTESFLAYNSASYDTSHNTSTLVQLASELYDTDNRFTNTASNYKYTVANAGKYFFFGNVHMSAASSQTLNQAFLNIYKNGSSIAQVGINYSGNYSDVTQLHITVSDDASTNDYYQLYNYAYTSGGANMIISGGNRGNTYFGGFRLA